MDRFYIITNSDKGSRNLRLHGKIVELSERTSEEAVQYSRQNETA